MTGENIRFTLVRLANAAPFLLVTWMRGVAGLQVRELTEIFLVGGVFQVNQ